MSENNVVTKEELKEILAEMRQEYRLELKDFRAETFARIDDSEKKTAARFDATDAKIEKLHSEFISKILQEQNETLQVQSKKLRIQSETLRKQGEMLQAQTDTIMDQNQEDDCRQWAEDFKTATPRQTEERRRAAEATINERTDRLLARIAKDRQEYEELKARLGPFEFEKVSAALAAVLEKARRSPFGRKRKKKK